MSWSVGPPHAAISAGSPSGDRPGDSRRYAPTFRACHTLVRRATPVTRSLHALDRRAGSWHSRITPANSSDFVALPQKRRSPHSCTGFSPWRTPHMAKALLGHVGIGSDLRMAAEVRRL